MRQRLFDFFGGEKYQECYKYKSDKACKDKVIFSRFIKCIIQPFQREFDKQGTQNLLL